MIHRKYLIPILAGMGMFMAVWGIDVGLIHFGMHAEQTHIDDALLGFLVAVLAYVLVGETEREARRKQQSAMVIDEMNHHIRNALQVIVARTGLSMRDIPETSQITAAVDRIDWALREILPHSYGEGRLAEIQSITARGKPPQSDRNLNGPAGGDEQSRGSV